MTHQPSRDDTRISLGTLLGGIARAVPDGPRALRGLLRLAWMRPQARGSIGRLLERHARRRPQATALRFDDRHWTYAQFNDWANRIADVLRARGAVTGEAVALLMENRPEALACVAGTVKLGAISGMLNHQQRGDVLEHSLTLTRARVIVVGEECRAALETTGFTPRHDATRQYLWDGEGEAPEGYTALRPLLAAARADNPPETQGIVLKSPAFYIFTSGTTGLPKASVMTHYRWLRGMVGVGECALRLRPGDTLYCCLPLYHNNALTVAWGAVLGAGATFALGRRFSASKFWDEVRHYRATSFCYIGELCRYLLNREPTPHDRDHAVRAIVGNGLRPELWDAFQARFGIGHICEFYGASESNLAFVNGFGLPRTAGYCPLPYAIVEFDADAEMPCRDARGRLQRVKPGGVGLLIAQVSAKTPFDGYTDRAASEAKLLKNVFAPQDRWFNTGDLVRDQGYRHIQFVDRIGDTFRWKGENVATTEVEAALNACDGIEQAVAYGVALPHSEGRAGMAAISTAAFDGERLAQQLRQRLPAYAVPLFLRLRTQQDTTATFKYRKQDLKRDGFDLARIREPVYVLVDGAYRPLDAERQAQIEAGALRF